MKDSDATEIAYKNGYEKAKQDILNIIGLQISELKKVVRLQGGIERGIPEREQLAICELMNLGNKIEGMK